MRALSSRSLNGREFPLGVLKTSDIKVGLKKNGYLANAGIVEILDTFDTLTIMDIELCPKGGYMAEMSREKERAELYKGIWGLAGQLRGSVAGWDFKQYVLGTMFYRYISENLTDYINSGEHEAGNTDFDYAQMSDEDIAEARDGLIEEKGFFLYPSELFCNVVKRAKDDENLIETLETIFKNIEDSSKGTDSEKDFAGLFDDFDVNSNKLGATVAKRNEKLVMPFSFNRT